MRSTTSVLALLLAGVFQAQAQPGERVSTPVAVAGLIFADRNANGVRDAGEPGVGGVAVSDQVTVTVSGPDGRFQLSAAGYGLIYVVQPDGYLVQGTFWRRAEPGREVAFGLVPVPVTRSFAFVHASDTHLSDESLPRTRRFRALVDSLRPSFVLISGDLIRDALRVPESEARGYYDMLARELAAFPVPVWTVPGNHEIFGIERHRSLVSPEHPLYGKRFYRSVRGPNYYGFTFGGVHFVGLDTIDYEDLWYYGHVDSTQSAWLTHDLASLPAGVPVVTFNHIPFVTGAETLDGYREDGAAPTTIRIGGKPYFRHVVQNTGALMDILADRLEIALGGHMHMREKITYETASGTRRFYQTAAVVGPAREAAKLGIRSGITLYRVNNGTVDEGTFVPLEP